MGLRANLDVTAMVLLRVTLVLTIRQEAHWEWQWASLQVSDTTTLHLKETLSKLKLQSDHVNYNKVC